MASGNLRLNLSLMILSLVLVYTPVLSQPSGWTWAKRAGSGSTQGGTGVSVDNTGNVLVTGIYQGTITFGSFTLTNSGSYDTFTVKYDSSGVVKWAKKSTGSNSEVSGDITNDPSGNTIVSGYFDGASVSFSGTFLQGYDQFSRNGFIVKYDPAGNVLWANSIRLMEATEDNLNVTSDGDGNIYVTGIYTDSVFFGTTMLSGGLSDVFVAKYDSSGNFIWAVSAACSSVSESFEITADITGNTYITGYFFNSITIGTTTLTSPGNEDVFIAKIDPAGNFLWAKKAGGSSNDVGKSIDVDPSGYAYVFGEFTGSATFGGFSITSQGIQPDLFLAKYDPFGNVLWVQKVGSNAPGIEYANGVKTGADGSPFISGSFSSSSITFATTTLINTNTANLTNDIFIAKFSTTGNPLWAASAAGSHEDFAAAVTVSGSGDCFVTGSFYSTTLSFGNIALTNALSNQTTADFYVAGFGVLCNTVYSTITDSGCNSYSSPSGNYIWTSSGTYSDTLLTSLGCDSIITVNLTINPFIPVQLTGGNQLCPGDALVLSTLATYNSYLWSDGSTASSLTVTTPGTYTVTATSVNGCSESASVVITYFQNTNVSVTALGAVSFCQGDSVVLSATSALTSYQWYRYNNPIPGATSMNYTAKARGRYKCIGQNFPLCPDTSNIIAVSVPCIPLDPNQQKFGSEFEESVLFEISTTNQDNIITIASPGGKLSVYNLFGQSIIQKNLTESVSELRVSAPPGLYLFNFQMGSHYITKKVYLK